MIALLPFGRAWGADYCRQLLAFDRTEVIGSLTIPANTPRGSLLLSRSYAVPALRYALCGAHQASNEYVGVRLNSPVGDGVYATGTHGLGYSVFEDGEIRRPLRSWKINNGGNDQFFRPFNYRRLLRVDLLKTDDISDGATFRACARLWTDSGENTSRFCLSGQIHLAHPTCTAATDALTFRLGRLNVAQLPAVGSTGPTSASQSIELRCDYQPRVVMRIQGNAAGDNPSLFALSPSPSTAKGVAVQLLRNGVALERDRSYRITPAANTHVAIPLAARYVRYGALGPGAADARMVARFDYE